MTKTHKNNKLKYEGRFRKKSVFDLDSDLNYDSDDYDSDDLDSDDFDSDNEDSEKYGVLKDLRKRRDL